MTQHADVDDYTNEIKRERDNGRICVGANLLITKTELTQDWPTLEAMIRAKGQQAAAGLIASAIELARARWELAQVTPPQDADTPT